MIFLLLIRCTILITNSISMYHFDIHQISIIFIDTALEHPQLITTIHHEPGVDYKTYKCGDKSEVQGR